MFSGDLSCIRAGKGWWISCLRGRETKVVTVLHQEAVAPDQEAENKQIQGQAITLKGLTLVTQTQPPGESTLPRQHHQLGTRHHTQEPVWDILDSNHQLILVQTCISSEVISPCCYCPRGFCNLLDGFPSFLVTVQASLLFVPGHILGWLFPTVAPC